MPDYAAFERESALGTGEERLIECRADVTLAERAFLSKVKVQRIPGMPTAAESGSICRWELADNTVALDDPVAFWTAPAERLLVSDTHDPDALIHAIAAGPYGDSILATDVSDALCVIRASGPGTRSMLAQCISIDPAEGVARGNRCAQTAMLKIPILLHWLPEPTALDIYIDRALARTAVDWLIRCAGGRLSARR